jgi:glycosyltransferase involved in cell wall biosynthesis
MRAAVFNAHWETLGGGEQVAGGMAAALGQDHDVELLVHETFDAEYASGRLGIDLTPFNQREIPHGTRAFLDITAEYDLLVNSSFHNMSANRARRSVYYVHFPVPYPEDSTLRRVIGYARDPEPFSGNIERQFGFWLTEFAGQGAWTKGKARMDLVVPRDLVLPFSFRLDARSWPPGESPHVDVHVGDERVYSGVLTGRETISTTVTGRGVADPIPVHIEADSFVPRLVRGTPDDRELGVIVSHARLGRPYTRLSPRYLRGGLAMLEREATEFLDSYDVIAANSQYTADCVRRLWSHDATVLSPPVLMRQAGEKRPIVLSVGRFFPRESGHSKKQLELVHAFHAACERGLRGWELHLVGGCKPTERRYVEDVRRAAVGLPVQFHVNAPGDDVEELFASAQIFWHGAGLGEDITRHPDRAEHFGITVVEAMSAGAVPLVYAHGGPAAIVQAHQCGRLYSTIDELAAQTVELARAPQEIERLTNAALVGARDFSFDRFVERTRDVVGQLTAGV